MSQLMAAEPQCSAPASLLICELGGRPASGGTRATPTMLASKGEHLVEATTAGRT